MTSKHGKKSFAIRDREAVAAVVTAIMKERRSSWEESDAWVPQKALFPS